MERGGEGASGGEVVECRVGVGFCCVEGPVICMS